MLFIPTPALPTSRTCVRHSTTPHMTAPQSIKSSNVLIIGGGPTGSVAAAHLHKRSIPFTLIEKQHDFTHFDVSRSYCLRLDYRAGRVLQQVDRLFEYVSANVLNTNGFSVSVLGADGNNVKRDLGRTSHEVCDLADLRPGVVDSLKRFVCKLPGVDARYGVSVAGIEIANDGLIRVTLQSEHGATTHDTRLLLACDGRNSQVAKLLDDAYARREAVQAPYGLGVESFHSPAVGLALKSIVLNEDMVNELLGKRPEGEFTVRQFVGDTKRGFDDMFRISLFPIGGEYVKKVGGFVGTIVREKGHNIWKIRDIDEAYAFFQANFPQMDCRRLISVEEMRRFVDARTSVLQDIRRRKSLAVKTGRRGEGAVVFLGDSAHAFPPDLGQGVNAAIGDVGAFANVLDEADENDELGKVVMRYDEERRDEGIALMKLSRFSAPYQYGVYPVRGAIYAANLVMRKILSKLLPGVLWPSIGLMIQEDLSYREIVRRGDVTTWRIVGAVCAVFVPAVAIAVRLVGG